MRGNVNFCKGSVSIHVVARATFLAEEREAGG
jgi:hypothetical protein